MSQHNYVNSFDTSLEENFNAFDHQVQTAALSNTSRFPCTDTAGPEEIIVNTSYVTRIEDLQNNNESKQEQESTDRLKPKGASSNSTIKAALSPGGSDICKNLTNIIASYVQVQLLKKTDVPQVIYIRNQDDVVRQLVSSVGVNATEYVSSHNKPYGDACSCKTLTDQEYKDLWESLHRDNIEDAPVNKGPTIFVFVKGSQTESTDKP